MSNFKHFKWKEFDCKSGKGKGVDNMDENFICMLDDAREIAGIPFNITSGYRTPEYNQALREEGYGASKNSSQLSSLCIFENSLIEFNIFLVNLKRNVV